MGKVSQVSVKEMTAGKRVWCNSFAINILVAGTEKLIIAIMSYGESRV